MPQQPQHFRRAFYDVAAKCVLVDDAGPTQRHTNQRRGHIRGQA